MDEININEQLEIIKAAVNALNNRDISYKSIAEFIGIGESAIKKFLSSEGQTDFNRNKTANQLRKFLVENFRLVAEKLIIDNAELVDRIRKLNDAYFKIGDKNDASEKDLLRHHIMVGRAYDFIYEMLGVSRDAIHDLAPKLLGDFTCYRPGTIENKMVVSSVEFAIQKFSQAIEYSHVAVDRRGEEKKADGPVLVIGSYIYLLGDVDSGCGIEYIVLAKPRTPKEKLMAGLCVTLNHLGEPIMGPVLLERAKCEAPRVIDIDKFERPELLADLKLSNTEVIKSYSLLDLRRQAT